MFRGRPVAFVRTPLAGVPSAGVTRVGEVPKTSAPLPVSSVTTVARLALEGVASQVATPVPSPDTPVEMGRPVAFVSVPDVGVPRIGVTKVGEVAKTSAPDPVPLVTAVAKFALEGVARNVAMPAPNPLTPLEIGRPVAFVRVPLAGVPSAGVTKVGLVPYTKLPVPVAPVEVTPSNVVCPVTSSVVLKLPAAPVSVPVNVGLATGR